MSADDGRSPSSGSEETDADGSDGSEGATTGRTGGTDREGAGSAGDGIDPRQLLGRVLSADSGPLIVVREVGVSVVTVVLIGMLLFGLSGVWPPMVAVESGSMEPHMHRGDLVFVSEPGRYVPDDPGDGRGVVTRAEAQGIDYRTFGGYGSVVVYDTPNRGGPPVIHRAHFWVEEGENWYDQADPAYHDAEDCDELRNCPAPHAGFITKGDANGGYDQVVGISSPVRPAWVVGVAQVRVPWLGHVRLWLAEGRSAALFVHGGDGPTARGTVAGAVVTPAQVDGRTGGDRGVDDGFTNGSVGAEGRVGAMEAARARDGSAVATWGR